MNREVCYRKTAFVFMLIIALDVQAEDTGMLSAKRLLKPVVSKWSNVKALALEVDSESDFDREFLEFRRSIGSPLQVRFPSTEGVYQYWADGAKFAYDRVSNAENGAVVCDEAGAWNGRYWQTLNRYPGGKPRLGVTRVRDLMHEGTGHLSSPFYYAFQFLVGRINGSDSGAGWKYAVTIEDVSNEEVWASAIARVGPEIETETFKGRTTFVLRFPTPFATRHPSTPTLYKVWFDREFPEFPIRVDSINERSGKICSRFMVDSFHRVDGFRIPKRFRSIKFDSESEFGNRPYLTSVFAVRNAMINPEIPEERFTFDASQARSVTDLETGNVIRVGE